MNVLFVLYGDFSSNSSIPLTLHARHLHRSGHRCTVALPAEGTDAGTGDADLRVIAYRDALADPTALFADGRPADILHAWTPREVVRKFVTSYLARRPTPWVVYLEDNEGWIARAALSLVGLGEEVLLQHSEEVITTWTQEGLSHPLRHSHFIGLADAAVVIQDKLAGEVPPWVPCTTVMPGVDLEAFSPRPADPGSRKRYGVDDGERVIVYPGGLNDFTRPGLEALCLAVGIINRSGVRCRLLRSGPVALDFLDRLPADAAAAVTDLGPLPRSDIPGLLALADIFVQPGKANAFEDLRLPGKLPELLASGRPVVLPDTNIAELLEDGVDAVMHRTGTPEEIADKCLALLADPDRSRRIGEGGRRFAEAHFAPAAQAARLADVYRATIDAFDPMAARTLWTEDSATLPVSTLLARKLRMLAAGDGGAGTIPSTILETHARCIEEAAERSRGLETGMAVRDRQIASLTTEVASRGAQVDALNQGVADLHTRLSASHAELDEERARLSAANAQLKEDRTELAALGRSLVQREAHIAALESSLSWRITKPLRVLGGFALRLLGRPGK